MSSNLTLSAEASKLLCSRVRFERLFRANVVRWKSTRRSIGESHSVRQVEHLKGEPNTSNMSKEIPKTNIPVVSAIIERIHNSATQVLVQTRWKPERDPVYSGTLEIPAGWIDEYENVYDALKREVLEETGLVITKIKPDRQTSFHHTNKDDTSFAFLPFCCQQQLKGGKPWVGFVFLCEVEDSEPIAQETEVKDIRWMDKDELRKVFNENPDSIFTLQLGVLDYYFSHT